jgi:hypothetical protein
MAASNAEQAVRDLFEFFAKQGWTTAGQAKRARIGCRPMYPARNGR